MNIFCPFDAYVQQVFVYIGQVKKGDTLIQLSSPSLTERFGNLMMTLEISEIQQRQFKDGRTGDKRQAQLDNLHQLEQKIKDYDEIVASESRGKSLGLFSSRDVNWAMAQTLNLHPSYLKQKLVTEQFDQQTADMERKLELTIARTKAAIENLRLIEKSLLIQAPSDGSFESKALPNLFYQQDEVIGLFFPPFEKKH